MGSERILDMVVEPRVPHLRPESERRGVRISVAVAVPAGGTTSMIDPNRRIPVLPPVPPSSGGPPRGGGGSGGGSGWPGGPRGPDGYDPSSDGTEFHRVINAVPATCREMTNPERLRRVEREGREIVA